MLHTSAIRPSSPFLHAGLSQTPHAHHHGTVSCVWLGGECGAAQRYETGWQKLPPLSLARERQHARS